MTTAATGVPSPIVSATTPPSASSASSAGTTLAGNFQAFLTILTTQLKNQNPLDPLDTNQFTQQLVQFAGVEQQLKTNSELAALQQSAQSTQALAFVGRMAVVDGNTANLTLHQAAWKLDVAKNSILEVSITNSTGQTVFSGSYNVKAGDNQDFFWDGKGTDGTQLADGNYTLTATVKDDAGKSVPIPTKVQGVVSSIDLTLSPPLLSINGQTYTVSQIKSIVG
jgi:flagellar basal-body rod modification protein FlgD